MYRVIGSYNYSEELRATVYIAQFHLYSTQVYGPLAHSLHVSTLSDWDRFYISEYLRVR